jgi:polyisoprenoid-binding protein YceI
LYEPIDGGIMAAADQVLAGSKVSAGLASGEFRGTWKLVPERSKVQLKTKAMWGLVPVRGTFSDVAGNAEVGDDGALTGRLAVKSASINTKMKKRDVHLRSDDFFDSDRFPDIVFEIDEVTPAAAAVTVRGRLIVRERSLDLSFPATFADLGSGEMAVDAEVGIDRSKLGVDFRAKGATKMDNVLVIHAVFTRG